MAAVNEEPGDLPASGIDPDELAAFLATAPPQLKGWADEQLAQLGRAGQSAADGEQTDTAVGPEAFADDLDGTPATPGRPGSGSAGRSGPGRVNLVLVTLLVAAVVIIIQQLGRPAGTDAATTTLPSSHPEISSVPSQLASVPVDQAQIDALKAQIEADPADNTARMSLGELYLDAGLYQDAIDALAPILETEPNHLDALLALGVAEYNLEHDDVAEAYWVRATQVAPDQPAGWYNLGFLYMSLTPPDHDRAAAAWTRVLELAPGTELAANAQAHLERMRASSPTPSTGG